MNEAIMELNRSLQALSDQLDKNIATVEKIRDVQQDSLMNMAADDGAIVPDESVFYLEDQTQD